MAKRKKTGKKIGKKHGNSVSGKAFAEQNQHAAITAETQFTKYLRPGQPTKYHPDFCGLLVKHMAKGFPYETFAAEVEVCRDTLYTWEKAHKEFSDAKKRGRAKQYLSLFAMGMAGATGKIRYNSSENTVTKHDKRGKPTSSTTTVHSANGFSTGAWAMMMKNCVGWKNEPELSEDDLVDSMDFDGTEESA